MKIAEVCSLSRPTQLVPEENFEVKSDYAIFNSEEAKGSDRKKLVLQDEIVGNSVDKNSASNKARSVNLQDYNAELNSINNVKTHRSVSPSKNILSNNIKIDKLENDSKHSEIIGLVKRTSKDAMNFKEVSYVSNGLIYPSRHSPNARASHGHRENSNFSNSFINNSDDVFLLRDNELQMSKPQQFMGQINLSPCTSGFAPNMICSSETPKFANKSFGLKVNIVKSQHEAPGFVENSNVYNLNTLSQIMNIEVHRNTRVSLELNDQSQLVVKTQVKQR